MSPVQGIRSRANWVSNLSDLKLTHRTTWTVQRKSGTCKTRCKHAQQHQHAVEETARSHKLHLLLNGTRHGVRNLCLRPVCFVHEHTTGSSVCQRTCTSHNTSDYSLRACQPHMQHRYTYPGHRCSTLHCISFYSAALRITLNNCCDIVMPSIDSAYTGHAEALLS